MKITIYELLGMVKDGNAPKKIKIGNKIYNYETFNIGKGDNYFTAEWEEVKGYRINYDGTYYYLKIRDYNLNDEVEILKEEKKIPEKIEYYDDSIAWVIDNVGQLSDVDKVIIDKLNQVIDYLKSKGE